MAEEEENRELRRAPDFKGDGAVAWLNKTREGEQYISLGLFGGKLRLRLFKNEPRQPEELKREKPASRGLFG